MLTLIHKELKFNNVLNNLIKIKCNMDSHKQDNNRKDDIDNL